MSIKKVHIINAHQKWAGIAEGNLTRHYVETMTKVFAESNIACTVTTVDDGYDTAKEVELLLNADLVILQFPMYWMSLPWLGKKYIDEVFMAGTYKIYKHDGREIDDASKKYGSGGLLKGKYMLSITCNAPLEAFDTPGQFFNGLGVDNAFMAVHNSMQFVGLTQLPTFTSHDIFKNPTIAEDTKKLEQMISDAVKN